MKTLISYSAALCVMCICTVWAGAQTPTPSPVSPTDDVVQITTKLVQVDAIVVDKNGDPVTNLKASDFELLQDGKPQAITTLSFVGIAPPPDTRVAAQAAKSGKTVISTSVGSTFGPAGRVLTFVVDDGNCSATTIGMNAAHDALKKFVLEQMLPNDRVAIYRTRAGSSLFQQYSSDKGHLLRAIDKIRWYPPTGTCGTGDGAAFDAARSNILDNIGPGGMTSGQIETAEQKATREAGEDFNRNNQVSGTIGVLNYIVRGLEHSAGRKLVFLMSDGVQIRSRTGQLQTAVDALHDLGERANRAGVVFNTIDVRGVYSTIMMEAGDEVRTLADVTASDKVTASRDLDARLAADGMEELARETGGTFLRNSNDLSVPVKRVLTRETGYYLIAYDPPENTFKGKHFNKIELRVKVPGLTVRSRPGFDAVVDQPARTNKRTQETDLYEAIAAPLPTSGIDLQLSAYFGNSAAEGDFVRSLLHVPGDQITFVDDAAGKKKAELEVVAVTMDENNRVVDEFTRTHTIRVPAEALPMIRQNGLIYSADVPIKKTGTYNFRVAVRDNASKALGSSSQMVDVPDLKKGRFYLSGLSISPVTADGKLAIPGEVKPENALAMTATLASPAIRQFHRGSVVAYSFVVYNAKLDTATAQPKVWVKINLYRNGQLISDGKPAVSELEKQPDWSRIVDFGYLRLNTEVEPGDYTLEVIVKDLASSDKRAASSQLIDFTVLP